MSMAFEWILSGILIGILASILIALVSALFIKKYISSKSLTLSPLIFLFAKYFGKTTKWFVKKNDFDNFLIAAANKQNQKKFKKVNLKDRTVFLPQCLRDTKCPARLSPEGIQCIKCGKCGIGDYLNFCEEKKVKVFVVPGSSFIKRMIKKYKPKGVIGVGCLLEVREGIPLINRLGIPVQGVKLENDGCVATNVDWDKVKEATIQE